MKKTIGCLLALLMLCMTAMAADTVNPNAYQVSYDWNAPSVAVGQTVSCNVSLERLQGTDPVGMLEIQIRYDKDKLRYDSAVSASSIQVSERTPGTLSIMRTAAGVESWNVDASGAELSSLTFTALSASEGETLTLQTGSTVTNAGAGYEFGTTPTMMAEPPALKITPSFTLSAKETEPKTVKIACTDNAESSLVLVMGAAYDASGRMVECRNASAALEKGKTHETSFTFEKRPVGGRYQIFVLDEVTYAPRCEKEVLRINE